mgnify:CR=1 FL=1
MDELLKDAIADAKAVRETALANAKLALEEAFTPRLKSMLSKKIQSEMEDACYETIKANDHLFKEDDEHRLMIDISRGVLGIYEDIEGIHKGPNIIVADFPLRWTVKGMSKLQKNGINNVVTSQRVIPSHIMDPKIKNRSRLFYLMANIEASLFKGDNKGEGLIGIKYRVYEDENGSINIQSNPLSILTPGILQRI